MNCQLPGTRCGGANVMNRSIGIDIPVRVISYHWTNEHSVMSDSDESGFSHEVFQSIVDLSDIGSTRDRAEDHDSIELP
ncbi:hypothetical protein Tco_0163880 [Tanacetum coccineum]